MGKYAIIFVYTLLFGCGGGGSGSDNEENIDREVKAGNYSGVWERDCQEVTDPYFHALLDLFDDGLVDLNDVMVTESYTITDSQIVYSATLFEGGDCELEVFTEYFEDGIGYETDISKIRVVESPGGFEYKEFSTNVYGYGFDNKFRLYLDDTRIYRVYPIETSYEDSFSDDANYVVDFETYFEEQTSD